MKLRFLKPPKRYCKNGLHEYTAENTNYDDRGNRYCRKCMSEKTKRYKHKKKNALQIKMNDLVEDIVAANPKVMRWESYRASELKKINIGAQYRAEIRADQLAEAQLNNDQAFGRRLSA